MGTGEKRIIPKVMREKTMKEVGQECSHLVRKNLGNRERQEPDGVFISPQSKEKEGKGSGAITTSQEKEEIGTGVGSRARSAASNSQGTRTPSNATPTDYILPKGPATVSNQQHKVQSRMKEHRATVRKLGQVQGLHSFHPRPELA